MTNVPQAAKQYVASIASGDDLRTVNVPGLGERGRLQHSLVRELLVAPMFGFTQPYELGYPTGELGSLQVYTTNPHSEWQGKTHAAGRCVHAEYVREDDYLLTLDAWISLLPTLASREIVNSNVCVKCGGYSIRLLTDHQADLARRAIAFTPALVELARLSQLPPLAARTPRLTLENQTHRLEHAIRELPDPETAGNATTTAYEQRVIDELTTRIRQINLLLDNRRDEV